MGRNRPLSDRALAVVSHELRQPLSVTQMNTALLHRLAASAPSRQIQSIAASIQRAIDSQTRIIDDLTDLARVRTDKLVLHRVPVDVGELTHTLISVLAATRAAGRITVRIHGAAPLVCLADPVRLEQVIGNLLSNALKFTPADGDIQVEVAEEVGFVRVRVTDTGCGIAAAFLPHVFGLFSQTGASAAGTNDGSGIGLALVHALVAAHGGRVAAASDGLGRGARFCVWLPLHNAMTASTLPPTRQALAKHPPP